MSKYTIGLDFGTLSVRALLLNIETGEETAVSEYEYAHGVMDEELPDGTKLPAAWALQYPGDYVEGLCVTIRALLSRTKVNPADIIGIGVDFTSCTILPTTKDGTPLCYLPEYKKNPHSYVKLWKHHAAQYCADKLNAIAQERSEPWLSLYGGKISNEWLVPKTMQIVEEAPEIYDAADRIIEAGDWIVWQMTGVEARSACNAGYKAIFHHKRGYPSKDFFKALHPKLENLVADKLSEDIKPLGSCAGYMTAAMAELTGLQKGTAVAVEIIDAHASVAACKIDGPGKMLMAIGTSTGDMLLSEEELAVKGTCGIVKDGVLPGLFAYDSGQSCVGDHFAWFVKTCTPEEYIKEADEQGISIHQLLTRKASVLKPGESGVLALDWWNGVRTDLIDFDLTGMMLGMNLQTRPEDIYRALIEATAYGARQVIETFEKGGVPILEIYAAGGIAEKNEMAMQIYADVCGREIKLSGSAQSGALGSAIYGAAAAGEDLSGYRNINEAARRLGKVKDLVYKPVPCNVIVYDRLFQEYKILHDYFGLENNVMKRLIKIAHESAQEDKT